MDIDIGLEIQVTIEGDISSDYPNVLTLESDNVKRSQKNFWERKVDDFGEDFLTFTGTITKIEEDVLPPNSGVWVVVESKASFHPVYIKEVVFEEM